MTSEPLRLAVVIASTRDGRLGDTVARWFLHRARARADLTVDTIDLRDAALPAVQSAAHPKAGRYPEEVAGFARRIAEAEAYVFVTPEYNHGYPASLKLALDSVYAEWAAKPASFVSYGGLSGGVRAVEQLRQVLVELHVVPLRDAVALPLAGRLFDEQGALRDEAPVEAGAKLMLDRLDWWGRALRAARAGEPYRP
jgi:NAD(P)H-dependent FMN reductase